MQKQGNIEHYYNDGVGTYIAFCKCMNRQLFVRDRMCLIGQSGWGKTHLASAVIITLAEKNECRSCQTERNLL